MNTIPVAVQSHSTPSSSSVTTRARLHHEAETVSPVSVPFAVGETEDEPPGRPRQGKEYYFPDVPASLWNDWKWHFRNRITTTAELGVKLRLTAGEQSQLELVARQYPLAITPYYLSLINAADPDDPIRRQSVPCMQEITMAGLGMEDPLCEKEDSVVPGLVHRYPDRALMVLTDICPMLCRHCTRKREWRHGTWTRCDADIEAMLSYIRKHTEIRDIIVSGGDPLTLSTKHLESIIARIRSIEHVEIIRIGSRFPVVLPQRIDDEFCTMLSKYGPIWFNTHFNHPRELTPESIAACDRLLRAGVPVNNQTVLLKGVNDSIETITALCHKLLKSKVRPYYLFQCDEVQGTEHLRTPVETGIRIIEGMRGHTSGLAIPTFVVDLVQGGGKVPLQPNYVLAMNEDGLLLKNYEGNVYRYRNPDPDREAIVSSGVVESLFARADQPAESREETDADRISVRS